MKMPYFHESLLEIRNKSNNTEYAEVRDLENLISKIQSDSRLGFSTVSFLRQAISIRESFMKEACCVRGRLCASSAHCGRDLLRHPPCAAELPEDFEESFPHGKPWFFCTHAFE